MTVFKLMLRNSGTIDYERKRLYTVDLTVSDGVFEDQAQLKITVLNVNDVTVEDVSGKVSTGGDTANGGGKVQITGTNFGILYGTDAALKPELDVTYGRIDKNRGTQWFKATNCALNQTGFDNTVIFATVPQALGRITSGMSTFFDRRCGGCRRLFCKDAVYRPCGD